MRAVFFGTPAHAVPALAALCGVSEVVGVVTQPDRPRGRSKRLVAPPVKEAAAAWGLPLIQPERAAETEDGLRSLAPDVALVAAFGQLIPRALLEIPEAGFVNVHFSLLPRWRGASPVTRAILAGDEITGVTLMQMDVTLDTGPVFTTSRVSVGPEETTGILTARLSALAAAMVTEHLGPIVAGDLPPEPQDESGATAARPVRVAEAFIDPIRHPAEAVVRAVRAFDPWPGAWSTVGGHRFKVWRARVHPESGPEPGAAAVEGGVVLLGTPDGAVELQEVQPEGRSRMTAVEWMRGRRGEPVRFEAPTPPPPR
jgi:methionyl-tRNA formyltransferase